MNNGRHQSSINICQLKTALILSVSLLFLAAGGCSKGKTDIPELSDDPVTAQITVQDLSETVPVYGIVAGSALEVNVENKDAPLVMQGQKATALVGSNQTPVECRVVNILRNANLATGMAIAWLRPVASMALPGGDFASAQITLKIKHHVATVPQGAVFIRDGKTMVIVKQQGEKEGEIQYQPVPVVTGIASDKDVEILSGLKPNDQVVMQAGIGFLYPEFQSQAGD